MQSTVHNFNEGLDLLQICCQMFGWQTVKKPYIIGLVTASMSFDVHKLQAARTTLRAELGCKRCSGGGCTGGGLGTVTLAIQESSSWCSR